MQRREDSLLCGHAALHLNGGHAAHGVPMNRAGLTKGRAVWIKTGLPQKQKTPRPVNQIKTKCCIRQIRLGGVRAFTAQVLGGWGGGSSSLLPPTQLNLPALLLARLIIILHRCAELSSLPLSSLICVTVGAPTSSFVRGHIAGSFGTGPPPGGDPSVHHGVTPSEEWSELELFSSFPSFRFCHLLCGSTDVVLRVDRVTREPQQTHGDPLDGTVPESMMSC